jgi:HAD superfamily phosphoserine phosphatase-like hydrolase
VALLDLDNTLVADWTIRPWLKALARRSGWRTEAKACAQDIEVFMTQMATGEIDHDELVGLCERRYVELMAGRPVAEVEEAAEQFVASRHNKQREHDFVRPLVAWLKDRCIAPIIVSGAPAELVRQYAAHLQISEYHGFSLVVENGLYTDKVLGNPGSTIEKARIVSQTIRRRRRVVLALGDSQSDMGLWDAAPNKVIVGSAELLDDDGAEEVFRIMPSTTSWQDLNGWLDERLRSTVVSEGEHP